MGTVLWIAHILLGLVFLLAGLLHGTHPVASLAPQMTWTAAVPLPPLRFIGLAGVGAPRTHGAASLRATSDAPDAP